MKQEIAEQILVSSDPSQPPEGVPIGPEAPRDFHRLQPLKLEAQASCLAVPGLECLDCADALWPFPKEWQAVRHARPLLDRLPVGPSGLWGDHQGCRRNIPQGFDWV